VAIRSAKSVADKARRAGGEFVGLAALHGLAFEAAYEPAHVGGFIFRFGLRAALVAHAGIADTAGLEHGQLDHGAAHADAAAERCVELVARAFLFARRLQPVAHGAGPG